MFGLIRALGNFVSAPVAPAVPGTGGPVPAKRRFELDVKPTKRTKIPEAKPHQRRIPEVHVALSLIAPRAVAVVDVAVAQLLPVRATLRLPWLDPPSLRARAQVTSRLGLANERIEELEAVLAAVMEDD